MEQIVSRYMEVSCLGLSQLMCSYCVRNCHSANLEEDQSDGLLLAAADARSMSTTCCRWCTECASC